MNKEFVPYELAVKLKELGFDEPCLDQYKTDAELSGLRVGFRVKNQNLIKGSCSAPLYQQAFRWFREKYELPSNLELLENGWDYVIYSDDCVEDIDYGDGPFETYEEAEVACLNKLIEIVQGGQDNE